MKKLSKLLLILALAVTVFQPCKVCEELKKNGTEEELQEHIRLEHDGIAPCFEGPHIPGEG